MAVIGLAVLAAGCNFGAHKTVVRSIGPGKTVTHSPHPQPTQTIHKGYPTVTQGTTTTITAQGGYALTMSAGAPSVSKTRLSPNYGYAPEHGYYITFPLNIKNTGQAPLLIERLDFYVKIPGEGKITTNDGAAPYSGAPQQLDTTPLAPGNKLKNKLTFDVSKTKGTLYYAPGGKPSIAWTFGG